MNPAIAANAQTAIAVAPDSGALRKKRRSMSGSGCLSACQAKPASAAAASAKHPRIRAEDQPRPGPSMIPYVTAASVIRMRTWPSGSVLRGWSARDSGTNSPVRISAATPTGMFTQNTPRQPTDATRAPPATGPRAMLSPTTPPHTPMARAEAAQQRAEGKDDQAGLECPLPAEPVASRAGHYQEAGQHEQVGIDDPLQPGYGGVQIPLDRRQRDIDDRRIQANDQQADAADGQDEVAAPGIHRRNLGPASCRPAPPTVVPGRPESWEQLTSQVCRAEVAESQLTFQGTCGDARPRAAGNGRDRAFRPSGLSAFRHRVGLPTTGCTPRPRTAAGARPGSDPRRTRAAPGAGAAGPSTDRGPPPRTAAGRAPHRRSVLPRPAWPGGHARSG